VSPDCDVAIVGAGPVGLSLALALARAGRRVLVLEKEARTAEHSRAPAIWPRTQEILDGLGVLPRFLERGIALRRLELYDVDRGRALLRVDLGELAGRTPFPQLLIVPQSRTEELLREALEAQPAAELRFSTEVLGLEERDATVRLRCRGPRGEDNVVARFTAGCDGAHSRVRESIGARFDGITYPLSVALADVEPRERADLSFPRISTRAPIAVVIKIDERLWRLILPFSEGDGLPLDERVEDAVGRCLGPRDYRTVWQSEFRLHRRMASRFVRGRIALAGDAAHLNSPVGGQGMNAGIQDAAALAPRLVEALERDDPEPLAAYERERKRAVAEVNRFTDRLTRGIVIGRGRLAGTFLRAAGLALKVPAVRERALRRIAMLEPRA
jgi:3-(3-hydroxy-phenyl)propionate hydroxylase